MPQTYYLREALLLNAASQWYDAVAAPVGVEELRRQKAQFDFDFIKLSRANTVYKLFLPGQPNVVQGLVAFRPDAGFLDCTNMESAAFNRNDRPLYNGVGKALVALCCKISFDAGFGGYIAFDAKTRLFSYYQRMGAIHFRGLRMIIEERAAQKLIERYF